MGKDARILLTKFPLATLVVRDYTCATMHAAPPSGALGQLLATMSRTASLPGLAANRLILP